MPPVGTPFLGVSPAVFPPPDGGVFLVGSSFSGFGFSPDEGPFCCGSFFSGLGSSPTGGTFLIGSSNSGSPIIGSSNSGSSIISSLSSKSEDVPPPNPLPPPGIYGFGSGLCGGIGGVTGISVFLTGSKPNSCKNCSYS